MKRLLLLLVILTVTSIGFAQAPDWLWAVSAGGSQYEEPWMMALDNDGNQYVTGRFNGTTTFGNISLTSFGDYDIFIAKLDPSGNWLWAKQAGGTQADIGNCIAVDNAGNVYVTGGFVGTATFGTVTLSHTAIEHLFLSKLDNNGNWLWTVEALGNDNEASSIAFDSDNNVYLTGAFGNTVNFGALPQMTCNGITDVFVAKLDDDGNWLWAVQGSGISWVCGWCIQVDSEGYLYLTGCFKATVNFSAIALTSSGGYDIFIAKLDGNGNWLWAKRAGGASNDYSCILVLDEFSNVYVNGAFSSLATFGPVTLTSSGSHDIFLTKLDSSGNWLWAIKAGGAYDDIANGVALDSENNAYVTGQFRGTAYFGPVALTSYGENDVFLAKEDGNGDWNWMWVIQAGGTGYDIGVSVQVGSANNIYVMGMFSNTATFGAITLTSSGSTDIFTGKLEADTGNADNLHMLNKIRLTSNPNPFNSETTISYTLPAKGQVCLDIYNSKGQLVKRLVNEPQAKGEHILTWNGKDDNGHSVASGLYLFRIISAGKQESRKLLRLK